MTSRLRRSVAVAGVAAILVGGLTAAPATAAAPDDVQTLVDRFAPVVRLVHQDAECGPGEPYHPSDVDAFLDNSSVALRGPWDQDDLVDVAPTAETLGAGLAGYHLDFPGNPLEPGCDYEEWARAATAGTEATTYAHVVTEPGRDDRLAIQYWLFYPFNDYTNKHEGDWEMVQLLFATDDPAVALDQAPIAVGYTQHEGARGRRLGRPEAEIVDGTHPVVLPGCGLARELLRVSALPRHVRRTGVRLRRHPRPVRRRPRHHHRHPERPGGREGRASRGSPSRGAGASARRLSTTGRPGPNTKTAGPTRSASRSKRAAIAATPFLPAVVRHLRHRLLLLHCVERVRGLPQARRQPRAPAPHDGPARPARDLPHPAHHLATCHSPTDRAAPGRRSVILAAGRMYASRWRLFIGIGFLTVPVSLL